MARPRKPTPEEVAAEIAALNAATAYIDAQPVPQEGRMLAPEHSYGAAAVVLDQAMIDGRMTAPDPSSDAPTSDEYVDDTLVAMVRDGVRAQVHRDSVPVMAELGWKRVRGA